MRQNMHFVQVSPENPNLCGIFREMMYDYIRELNEHLPRKLPRDFWDRWIDSILSMQGPSDRHLELCFREEQAVGFLYGKVDHADHKGFVKPGFGYIMEFYVPKALRRQGLGREMALRMEALFRRDGAKRVYLTADPVTGRPFWEALGYGRTGEQSPENLLDIYEKEI